MTPPEPAFGRPPTAVVLDDSALLALGAGNPLASRLIVAATGRNDRYVFAPAMCLVAAVAERPELADHVGSLEAIEVLDLTYSSASLSGAAVAIGTSWRRAHALAVAAPSADWPEGLPVVTSDPDAYRSHGVVPIPLTPNP